MNPYTAAEILTAFQSVRETCTQACASFTEADFGEAHLDKWSAAQNLEHLIKSTKPLTQGLSMPLIALKAIGKPNRPVRDFATIVARYQEKLAAGGVATSGFEASASPSTQAELIAEWTKTCQKLEGVIEAKWQDEAKLDRILLPHPLLGKLMVREMLFFTIYHTTHHTQAILRQNEAAQ